MTNTQIEDDLFGTLKLDERFKTWHGHLSLDGRTLGLEVYATLSGDIDPAMRQAFKNCQSKGFDYGLAAAAEMLDYYNANWNNDTPIDAETFANQLMLENVVVEHNGTVTLWYNDGDLFGGHVVFVEINAEGVVTRAEIAG